MITEAVFRHIQTKGIHTNRVTLRTVVKGDGPPVILLQRLS